MKRKNVLFSTIRLKKKNNCPFKRIFYRETEIDNLLAMMLLCVKDVYGLILDDT